MPHHEVAQSFYGSLANSPSSLDLSELTFGCLILFPGYIVGLVNAEQGKRSINHLIWTRSLLCAF